MAQPFDETAVDLLKGLDFEETALTWAVAAVLVRGRDAFPVRHDRITLRSALWRVPLLALAARSRRELCALAGMFLIVQIATAVIATRIAWCKSRLLAFI